MHFLLLPVVYSQSCFSLQGTTKCPEFGNYSVQAQKGLFTNLKEFDDYIVSSFPNSTVYQSYFDTYYNCPNFNGTKLRYSISLLCGMIVDVSTTRFSCNSNPKQLCRETAQMGINSFNQAFSLCPKNDSRQVDRNMATFVDRLSGQSDCIKGVSYELDSCGFVTDIEAKLYCSSANDTCCESFKPIEEHGGFEWSPWIIGAVVASGVVIIGIVIGIIYVSRKKEQDHPTAPTQTKSNSHMQVIFEYTPNLYDEIHLAPGDMVNVKHVFDDGWAYGMNMTTRKEGSFPMACLSSDVKKSNHRTSSLFKQ